MVYLPSAILLALTGAVEAYRLTRRPVAALAAAGAAAEPPENLDAGPSVLGMKPKEAKKIVPLGIMLFCILFNYTILRNTKDVLVVTAPKSGAEIIPFLKTYVQLPGAIAFAAFYSTLSNRYQQGQIVTGVTTGFLVFYAIFAFVMFPNVHILHPNALCDSAAAILPASFAAPIAVVRNWTFTLFYLMAELWGSVVLSLLFWGFANQITTVDEAKKYYPLFGLFANVALICAGGFSKKVSTLKAGLAVGVDPWGFSLKLLMGGVVGSGLVLLAAFTYLQRKVVTDPECVDPTVVKKSKVKTKMTLRESIDYLSKSSYIRNLAFLVIGYGMSINLIEVTWKAKLKQGFPNPSDYSAFMANFSAMTGATTIFMMLLGQRIFATAGWGAAALVTPVTMLVTGGIFFSLILQPALWAPITSVVGLSPLMMAVFVGAAQNVLTKASKYGMFDPCKEMAYIPLEQEQKTKGKAAIDVIGNPLGKSGGAFIQQILIISFGSLAACAPVLGGILLLIVVQWIRAARQLNKQFIQVCDDQKDFATCEVQDPASEIEMKKNQAA
jgi:AAA family ATP:ADP antiporter